MDRIPFPFPSQSPTVFESVDSRRVCFYLWVSKVQIDDVFRVRRKQPGEWQQIGDAGISLAFAQTRSVGPPFQNLNWGSSVVMGMKPKDYVCVMIFIILLLFSCLVPFGLLWLSRQGFAQPRRIQHPSKSADSGWNVSTPIIAVWWDLGAFQM